jgi:hypothetical protein
MGGTKMKPTIFVAILAKQKAPMLPAWLESLYRWDYPKDRITLYIRSNNNTDPTSDILKQWANEHRQEYASVIEDYSDLDINLEQYKVHEWNATRFKALGAIREKSVRMAQQQMADFYFVIDVDNFIKPDTLTKLVELNLPAVAPLLRCVDDEQPAYSNYHLLANVNGYYLDDMRYYQVVRQEIKGLILCDVIHCTYLLRNDILKDVRYLDGTDDYEYVIFSRVLRAKKIPQYLDNREIYGHLSLRERTNELVKAMKGITNGQ